MPIEQRNRRGTDVEQDTEAEKRKPPISDPEETAPDAPEDELDDIVAAVKTKAN
jgi:hypothetical protein